MLISNNKINSHNDAAQTGIYRPVVPLILAALSSAGLLVLFNAFPILDLTSTGWFFKPGACIESSIAGQTCGSFPLSDLGWLKAFRYLFYYLPHASAVVILGLMIRSWRRGAAGDRVFLWRATIALLSLLIGPVLLVNGLLKGWSGRPRPYDSLLFGGDMGFVAAGDLSGLCERNCSFISGEASGVGWLVCAALLLPKAWRPLVLPPLIALTLMAGSLRMMFGGHYLSDITLGWLSSILVFLLLAVIAGWPQDRRN